MWAACLHASNDLKLNSSQVDFYRNVLWLYVNKVIQIRVIFKAGTCVCFASQSTRELEKLSEGSSVTTKDLIVTLSQPDKHWPIYSEPTLLSNGSSAFLALPPLTSPPFSHLLSPPYSHMIH